MFEAAHVPALTFGVAGSLALAQQLSVSPPVEFSMFIGGTLEASRARCPPTLQTWTVDPPVNVTKHHSFRIVNWNSVTYGRVMSAVAHGEFRLSQLLDH